MAKSSSMEMHFRSSLRDAANNKSPPCKLHRGCSGHLHGQGVLKVKSKVDPPPCHRSLAAARDSRSSSRSPVCYDRGIVPGYDLHRSYNNNNNSSRETDDSCYNSSSDVESSPVRKKSMLGLGKVLPAPASAECKSILPPRSPPKFLAFSTRSLSSSTCSSDQSSSSRYSGISTPSPGIYDYPSYSNPLQWPSAAAASSGLYLEEVSEELDDDLDQWSDHPHNNNNRRPSPSPPSPCSTLASSTYESSIDQGRRLAMSPHQLRHSTPNRSPYTERNRPSNSSSGPATTTTTKKATPSTLRRSTLNSNNNNKGATSSSSNGLDSGGGVGGKKKSAERIAATPLMKNKRVADLVKSGGQSSPSSRCSSPSLSRQNSAGSSSRSSLVSQRSTLDTLPKRPSSSTSGNQKQRTTVVVAAKPKSSSSSSSAAIKKTAGPNRNSGSSQQLPPTPQAKKEEESNESDQEVVEIEDEIDLVFFILVSFFCFWGFGFSFFV